MTRRNKSRKRLVFSDYVPILMSWLSVCLLACQFIWTSQNALGSCDCLLRSFGTDNPLVYTLACVKTSPNALGSCCESLLSALGSCCRLRSCKTKEIKNKSTNSNIIPNYPLGRGEAMTSHDCPSFSPDAHSASSVSDSETSCLHLYFKKNQQLIIHVSIRF